MRFRRVLILGCGVIGSGVLDLLSRCSEPFDIIVAARDEDRVVDRINLTVAVAMNLGYQPQIRSRCIDVAKVHETAELLRQIQPEIIVNATSLQTFWLISTLPNEYFRALSQANIGPWLPNHLALTRKIMQAVQMTNPSIRVVNASFPDTVNPVLNAVGLAPYIGAGNIANTIPTLRRAAAYLLNCTVEKIDVRFVAHHFVGNHIATYGESGGAPYHLRIFMNGVEATDRINMDDIFSLFTTKLKRLRGVAGQVMAASSVAAIVRAIASDSGTFLHAPGPNGLVGGYPVRVGADSIDLMLPTDLPLDMAIRVNQGGQLLEGIEDIDAYGTIHYAEREMAVMKQYLGYECREMKLDDVDGWAEELRLKYQAFVRKIGVKT